MKQKIRELVAKSVQNAYEAKTLSSPDFPPVNVEEPKIESHGDFSTNMAMIMASGQKMPPRKIAEAILAHIEDPEGIIAKAEIAGPGFINFTVNASAWLPLLRNVHEAGDRYGFVNVGNGQKVQVEFVSANPTGPLHVGHGRGAAVGDTVANILAFCGYDVQREYYINDSGRQIRTLGKSVWLRYQEICGQTVEFPEDCYQGDYIRELAAEVKAGKGENLKDDPDAGMAFCGRFAADAILNGIREDLEAFGVRFDNWYSEKTLYDSGKVDGAIEKFRESGIIYEKDGALWFNTSQFGDEKDRVVVTAEGRKTYFASDIAYHREKYERGLERVIDVWGADHHGYIPRIKAAVEACGHDPETFNVILIQLVNLLRGGQPVAMSSRAGEFVTLKEVVDEVGTDAARFIFLTRHYESKLDFDLEVAKQKTNDNPVHYVQYVHARISSIIEKAGERGITTARPGDNVLALLDQPGDIQLVKAMSRYPEAIEAAARLMEPHRITYYLTELASAFHTYYTDKKNKVLDDEQPELSAARLFLVTAVRKVIRNGLSLLGVSAPEKM